MRTVAVFSEADRDSLPVRLADEAVCIGPPPTARSYLNMPNIVMAASCEGRTPSTPGPDPGREAQLRRDLRAYQVAFVGPRPETIERLGKKTWPGRRCGRPA